MHLPLHGQIDFGMTAEKRHTAVMAAVRSAGAAQSNEDPGVVDENVKQAVAIIAALDEAGTPNLSLKDHNGLAPLHVAVHNGQFEIVRELVQRGSRVNARAALPLPAADGGDLNVDSDAESNLPREERKERKMARDLVKRGVTPLQLAIEKRRHRVVDYLLFQVRALHILNT